MDWDSDNTEPHNLKSVNDTIRSYVEQVVRIAQCERHKTSTAKRTRVTNKNKCISQLNGLVRLWNIKKELEEGQNGETAFTNVARDSIPSDELSSHVEEERTNYDQSFHIRELLLCLRIPLVHESSEIRASTLKTIRLLLSEYEDVNIIQEINLHHLIVRSLDIDLDNKLERIQALKLVRKCAQLGSKDFPLCLARAVVALVDGGAAEGDRLYRSSLFICCELSILHSDIFMKANGIAALTHAILDCSVSRMIDTIIGCLAALHNDPKTRHRARIQLGVVVAPFTEFRYVHNALAPGAAVGPGPGPGPGGGYELGRDPSEEREFRFQCAETAILSMMRTWPGLLQMTEPGAKNGVSHLQALIDILHLENSYVRKKILLLLYEVLNVKAPTDLSNFSMAVESTNSTSFRENWKLAEDFIAKEGVDILPRLAKSRPNLLESHIGYLLAALLKTELPDALVKVIVNASSNELSILATILLGELLQLSYVLLPRELNATTHCLPALLAEVSSKDAVRSNRAAEAVDALHRIYDIKKRGPVANSLFLAEILAGSPKLVGRESFIGDRLHLPANWNELLKHEPAANERVNASIRDSQVNNVTVDPDTAWDWNLITSVFKWPSDVFRLQDTLENRNFVRRVVEFFKPSGNKFSAVELKMSNGKHNKRSKYLAKTGCYLMDFLVSDQSTELSKALDDFLSDIQNNFRALIDAPSTHDCFFSPTRVATTSCQYYFLLVGRLSRSKIGRQALDRHQILHTLSLMLSLRSDLYMKLVVSSLDYSASDWGSQNLLSKALTKESESCRLYATRFLGILIRSRTSYIAQWGINLLVCQLFDSSKAITWVALEILEDACDDKMNLEAVVLAIKTRPLSDLNHLGLKGVLLYTRFLSSNNGFEYLSEKDDGKFLENELKRWNKEFNLKYASLIEELLNDGLSRHQLNETRCYGRRSRESYSVKDVFVPPHLYGQLSQTAAGLEILKKEKSVIDVVNFLVNKCNYTSSSNGMLNDTPGAISVGKSDWTNIKAAIWAIAHISSSSIGAKWVESVGGILAVISIAENCDVYSLRGTAFYALGLTATNKYGCHLLSLHGWCSLRYGRNDQLPINDDWLQYRSHPVGTYLNSDSNRKSIDEGSDAAISSLGTSFSDPDPPFKCSMPDRPFETGYVSSKESENQINEAPTTFTHRDNDGRRESFTSSSRKRLSSIMRSLSLGKEDAKNISDTEVSVNSKSKDREDVRRSFTLPKRIMKIKPRRSLFPKSVEKGKHPNHSLSKDEPGCQTNKECISENKLAPTNQESKIDDGNTINNAQAPYATPEDSSDNGSDKLGSSNPLGNIQEESMSENIVSIERKSVSNLDKHEFKELSSGVKSNMEEISNAIVEKAVVYNTEATGHQNTTSVNNAIGMQESSTIASSSLSSKILSVDRKTLSPIASSTSITAIGLSDSENSRAHDDSARKNELDGDSPETTTTTVPLHVKTFSVNTTRTTNRAMPPVPFRRTGKRAFSESEAQNVSHVTRNTNNIPAAFVYWQGDRTARSEHSYSGNPKNSGTPVQKISLISGSQQATGYPIESPGSGLCTSVTSVSSSGSWADNPGYLTLQDLRKRKRPQLVDNEAMTTVDVMSKASTSGTGIISIGQDHNRHIQRAAPGLFKSADRGITNTAFSSYGSYGVPRRDSIAQTIQNLDHRFKFKPNWYSKRQGKLQPSHRLIAIRGNLSDDLFVP